MSNNIRLIQDLYTAYRAGDFEAFASLCSPELEWIQSEGFPYGGHHHGAAAVVEGVFQTLPRHWDGFGFDVNEMVDAGSHVVVLGAYRGTHRVSGRSFRADTAHVFDIAGGRVRRFRQYTDTALICDATRKEEPSCND